MIKEKMSFTLCHSAVSDLGLHCLPVSHKKEVRLILVKVPSVSVSRRVKRAHTKMYPWRNNQSYVLSVMVLTLGLSHVPFTYEQVETTTSLCIFPQVKQHHLDWFEFNNSLASYISCTI